MSWRPEGWKNCFYVETHRVGDTIYGNFDCVRASAFEAGADAMLEALRKEGQHFSKIDIKSEYEIETRQFNNPVIPGTWVFIPDEEEKC